MRKEVDFFVHTYVIEKISFSHFHFHFEEPVLKCSDTWYNQQQHQSQYIICVLVLLSFLLQMQKAMNDAARQAFVTMMFSPQNVMSINQFLVVNVTRDHLVEDAMRELSQVDPQDLKKPLRVCFYPFKFHEKTFLFFR